MKSSVDNDLQFVYLKWILNNVNHVTKLEIHLYNNGIRGADRTIWKSVIDANFIRQYCLPDQIINLKHFQFYIRTESELLLNNCDKIRDSFQIDPFFVLHQWTNVQCFYDAYRSHQYVFSSNLNKFQFFNLLM